MFFLELSLTSVTEGRQHYDAISAKGRETRTFISWPRLVESFANRYITLEKQAKISNRLEHINVKGVRRDEEDDYATLEKLTKRANELALMAPIKHRDDVANVRLSTKAIPGTR